MFIMLACDNLMERYDDNQNGVLEIAEVQVLVKEMIEESVFGERFTIDQIDLIIADMDKDGNKQIDKQELQDWMKKQMC